MKLSSTVKQEIAKKASIATIAKRRDEAFKALQKELTRIADLMYDNVSLLDMAEYAEYINYENCLHHGNNYPEGFIEVKRKNRYQYLAFGFVPSDDIPLLKYFPCKANKYHLEVNKEYEADYEQAVRKYIHLYFEAQKNYKLILESLNTINTDKQLEEEFPELLFFFALPESNGEKPVSKEKINSCKTLLKQSRHLFLESL